MKFNKVFFGGNLTRDPALKYLPNQTPVVDFGVACNRKYKTQSGEEREEVTFVDCVAFGNTAEMINKWFVKGKPIFIEGSLKYESWEKDGVKRSTLKINVANVQFCGDNAGGGTRDNQDRSATQRPASRPAPKNPVDDQPAQFGDDEIPFD
jgi:single-strand DNA-binding protein